MRTLLLAAMLLSVPVLGQWPSNYTPTHSEAVDAYRDLAEANPRTMRFAVAGETDSGSPMHVLIIDENGSFDPAEIRKSGRPVCMVMNAIHAGEACGVNASYEFATGLGQNPGEAVYLIIPIYNVGGAIQRNSTTRANQNGPESYGFRGNARNLDLNRDFIKADSKNTLSFSNLYHTWNPHIFIDTHTSNGADYQASMTLISTFPEKLNKLQASLLERDMLPALYEGMEKRGVPMTPYVNTVGPTPESGIAAFTDLPRYSTGYVALFNTIGFTTEAHMLKSFDKRVEATRTFLETMHELLTLNGEMIVKLKSVADKDAAQSTSFPTGWNRTMNLDSLSFSGYRADTVISAVTGLKRIKYDRTRPYTQNIAYYKYHEKTRDASLPAFYVIPNGWDDLVKRLDANGIQYRKISADSSINVRSTIVRSYQTREGPYEGHYPHYNTKVGQKSEKLLFTAGSILIPTNQPGNRYLSVVFDPENPDSFFTWNFFDAYLTQKEYFSSYIFEDTAEELLKSNGTLRKAFNARKAEDADFASDSRAQLDFIYENSPYKEPVHMRLPVFEIARQ